MYKNLESFFFIRNSSVVYLSSDILTFNDDVEGRQMILLREASFEWPLKSIKQL